MAYFETWIPTDTTGKSTVYEYAVATWADYELIEIAYDDYYVDFWGSFFYDIYDNAYGDLDIIDIFNYVGSFIGPPIVGGQLLQTWEAAPGTVYPVETLVDIMLNGTAKDLNKFLFYLDDEIYGSEYNDKLNGWNGDDYIDGWKGNDKLWGDKGNDELLGWKGNDKLWGGKGNDDLWGEKGNDKLWGEKGNDAFYFDKGDKKDTIKDLNHKKDEIIIDKNLAKNFKQIKQAAENYKKGVKLDFGKDELKIEDYNKKDLSKFDFDFA